MSALLLKFRRIDDIVILDLIGKVTMGEGAVQLRSAVRKTLDAGDRKFLINLANVDYVDSAGLGELVAAFVTITHLQGRVRLLNLTRRIRDLLQITKLITVFETFDSETEALKSFR